MKAWTLSAALLAALTLGAGPAFADPTGKTDALDEGDYYETQRWLTHQEELRERELRRQLPSFKRRWEQARELRRRINRIKVRAGRYRAAEKEIRKRLDRVTRLIAATRGLGQTERREALRIRSTALNVLFGAESDIADAAAKRALRRFRTVPKLRTEWNRLRVQQAALDRQARRAAGRARTLEFRYGNLYPDIKRFSR